MVDEALLRKELDAEQCKAALQIDGPVLILAGAGSGKTRAVTYKIAHLISAHGISPNRILAVTFTNKAAKEMKERIQKLLGEKVRMDWMGTFHGVCLKILKMCLAQPLVAERSGWTYSRNFTIYDDDDQKKILKAVVTPILGDVDAAELRKISGSISRYKNSLCLVSTPQGVAPGLQTPEIVTEQARTREEETRAKFYAEYQARLMAADAMDFDDLLFRTVQLLQKFPSLATQFGQRFQQIFVDEYQDTNDIQYWLLRLLMNPQRNVTVVGDDDQSIYGWRGANIAIIRSFHQDFAPVKIVKLERNYRSTRLIVRGAGSVIENNERPAEMRKKVYSEQEDGERIRVSRVRDDREEALSIASKIRTIGEDSYAQTAVFYRTNAQSRVLEKSLNDQRIPAVIFGGLRFWDRKEVKDMLAYLRLLVNPRDDAALGRILNVPTRGIGKTSADQLAAEARSRSLSQWETLDLLVASTSKAAARFQAFHMIIAKGKTELAEGMALPLIAEHLLDRSGYGPWLKEEDPENEADRMANLGELINALREYEEENEKATLEQFLQEVALLSDADKKVEEDANGKPRGKVTLMTIHMAKGLEFDHVHIAGCDENIFPLVRKGAMSEMSPSEMKKQIEEERRLFYVGATRARKNLSIYSAQARFWMGSVMDFRESRFLQELDPETVDRLDLISSESNMGGYRPNQSSSYSQGYRNTSQSQTIRKVYPGGIPIPNTNSSMNAPKTPVREVVYDESSQVENPLRVGVMVRHAKLGIGLVRGVMGQGSEARVDVEFQDGSVRKLVLKYANLTILERE